MDFLKHIELSDNSKWNDDFTTYTEKIAIHFVNMRDKFVLQNIIAFAQREGITDLYLLDAEFVKTALLREIQIRKDNREHCIYCGSRLDKRGASDG